MSGGEHPLNQAAVKWFERRGISVDTLVRMGVYTGLNSAPSGEPAKIEPNANGNLIVFPFIERGVAVNEKYRGANKLLFQRAGGRKTFYNSDVLDDPALAKGDAALVITEGEPDCLSFIEAGHPWTVSVPDGAPPGRDGQGNIIKVPKDARDIDPENDDKFAFIANNWERLKKIKRIIIAVDGDDSGIRLADELVRRIGRVRCYWVKYPEEPVTQLDGSVRPCKDANEVLLAFGASALMRMLAEAKPYPVSGVYTLSEFPPEPKLEPLSTGFSRLDEYLKVYIPAFMVITGLANNGKSIFAQHLVSNLASRYQWPCAIASFETRVRPFLVEHLAAPVICDHDGNPMERLRWGEDDLRFAYEWVERNFVFIAPDPDDEERDCDVDWLIEKAQAAVIRYGIRVLLIDPWNELEHKRRRDENSNEYTGRVIRSLKQFAKNFGVLVILVAHPTKEGAKKEPENISLYDISDSSHFANKADLGVVIARYGTTPDSPTMVSVKKVRFQPETGRLGHIDLIYSQATRTFSQ